MNIEMIYAPVHMGSYGFICEQVASWINVVFLEIPLKYLLWDIDSRYGW